MNKRLLELAEQCEYEKGGFVFFDKEKFALWVVQECMEVVIESDPSPKMSLGEPYGTIIDNMKVHFGLSD